MKSSSQTPPEKVTLKPKLLEEVIINYDHAEFIDANVQIKKLSINYNVLSFHPVDTSADFFYEQTKLTSLNMINLHLGAQRCRIFRDIVPDKIKFRLKHLAMVYTCNDNNMYVLENIAKFIKSQKELRTISLKGPVSFEMWHAIMELPLLEKLEFTSHFLCKFALSGRVRRSPSLKELVITGDMKNEVFRNILDYMPGITKLVNKGTFFMNKVHLKHLAEKVPNLHTLHLRVFDTDVDFKEPFVFKNLKDMKIEAVKMHQGFSDRCVNFVRMFPAIERMIFLQGTFKSHIPFSVMDKLLYKLENLQYLELGPTFVNSNVIEYIR